jgi:hypothetical protein
VPARPRHLQGNSSWPFVSTGTVARFTGPASAAGRITVTAASGMITSYSARNTPATGLSGVTGLPLGAREPREVRAAGSGLNGGSHIPASPAVYL